MVDQKKPDEEKEILRALDYLFISARRYRPSREFKELVNFVTKFLFYSSQTQSPLKLRK